LLRGTGEKRERHNNKKGGGRLLYFSLSNRRKSCGWSFTLRRAKTGTSEDGRKKEENTTL